MPKIDTNIKLTSTEQELFEILTKASEQTGTTVRVAGGWVRDKLMGLYPDDVDVVVDNIKGIDFAKIVSQMAGSKKDPVLIEENPEKTKNIETATANIPLSSGGIINVDFAQARVEEYPDPNSRNPIVRPGIIEEDAMRRDLTINSMFYNIKTGEVEDFTGKGINDLKNNILRSPKEIENPFSNMSPEKTFTEDPLRIFRVIRFAARFNGKISPRTYEAMKNPEIISSVKKLAKERIGKEIEKTLSGTNPLYAIEILKDIGLFDEMLNNALKGTVFENQMENLEMNQNNTHHDLNLWEHTLSVLKNVLNNYPEKDPEKRAIMTFAALFHDLGKLFKPIHAPSKTDPSQTSYSGHDRESAIIASHLLKYLKLDKYIDNVSKIVKNHMRIESLMSNSTSSKALRKFIRNMTEEGIDWLDMFNLALADGYSKERNISEETILRFNDIKGKLESAFMEMGEPLKDKKIKPPLNGFELMEIFNQKKGGRWIAEINEYMFELMDEYPSESRDKDWVKDRIVNKFPQHINNTTETKEKIDVKSSNEKEQKTSSSCCPMHLFNQKKKEIKDKIQKGNLVESITIMNELKDQYGEDEKVYQLIAKQLFFSLLKNRKNKQNEILQYVFSKAEKNFFDPIVCIYSIGSLLLLKTNTKSETILKIAKRMQKMSPELLKFVINKLPSDIPDKKTKQKIEALYEN